MYPTDTLYGFGADAFSDEAVAKVYDIKSRDERKPIHCVVDTMEMAAKYGIINATALRLATEFLPGPLTIVVEKSDKRNSGIARDMKTIGFRIPKHDFCIALARAFGKPYTTTSANISGEKSELSSEKILSQLGDIASCIDLVIDAGELSEKRPSTVVGVSDEDIAILREGAIPASKIWNALS